MRGFHLKTTIELLDIIHELYVVLFNHSTPQDSELNKARVRILAKVEPMVEFKEKPFAIPED